MSKEKKEVTEVEGVKTEEVEPLPVGIIKKFVQNGHMYHRIRNEAGQVNDVRV